MTVPTVLVSWSGGIDSTSCLWQLLRDGHQVIAHHVTLKSPDKRWEAEAQAIERQRKWFERNGYDFIFKRTGFDYGDVVKFTRDINVTGFAAGFVAAGYPTVKQAVISSSLNDVRRQGDPRIQQTRMVITELLAGRNMEWIAPNRAKPKAQVMAEMPPDLLALCWYCRHPQKVGDGFVPCGGCQTCKEVKAAKEEGLSCKA